ncbi:uncharacterized protein ARMOST_07974 [Armillaria ostoyae]|uniref:Uncharacterized protein n=1 Tax=Armillaria ostoyae TaxID=47428 RepID=A0A284R7B5_ARMOS|nr:uncharacterized protein ARMOST_07974 [Armillaria ostoyae]
MYVLRLFINSKHSLVLDIPALKILLYSSPIIFDLIQSGSFAIGDDHHMPAGIISAHVDSESFSHRSRWIRESTARMLALLIVSHLSLRIRVIESRFERGGIIPLESLSLDSMLF